MKNKGFSLVELLIVMAVIAAMSIIAFMAYPRLMAQRNANYEVQNIQMAAASAKTMFASGNYSGLTAQVAIAGKFFPSDMTVHSSLMRNKFGGTVSMYGSNVSAQGVSGAPAPYFSIIYNGVPNDVCLKMAPLLARNFGRVMIQNANGADIGFDSVSIKNDFSAPPVAISEQNIARGCARHETIRFIVVSN